MYHTFQRCISSASASVTLSCPFDHSVRVTSAAYYLTTPPSLSSPSGCDPANARSQDGCVVQYVTVDVLATCSGKVECHVEVAKRSEVGSCGAEEAAGGQHMFEVTFSCTQGQ